MMGGHTPLAVTMGDPAGINGEIIAKAWQAYHHRPEFCFFVIGCPQWLSLEAQKLGCNIAIIERPDQALSRFSMHIPVLPLPLITAPIHGISLPQNAPVIVQSIDRAVAFVKRGQASAIVTLPLHKAVFGDAGLNFYGHTEYLATLDHRTNVIMMLANDELRVVPLTIHVPLAQVPPLITPALLHKSLGILHDALQRDFGIHHPKIAVSGLNPHAGEGGLLGFEETQIIKPTLEKSRAQGLFIDGPLPADSLFHPPMRRQYDAILCMYHDQALIPIKMLDFEKAVNITLGLSFIRTSPDHGTAYDLAGKGIASPHSLIAAIKMAHELHMVRH